MSPTQRQSYSEDYFAARAFSGKCHSGKWGVGDIYLGPSGVLAEVRDSDCEARATRQRFWAPCQTNSNHFQLKSQACEHLRKEQVFKMTDTHDTGALLWTGLC